MSMNLLLFLLSASPSCLAFHLVSCLRNPKGTVPAPIYFDLVHWSKQGVIRFDPTSDALETLG